MLSAQTLFQRVWFQMGYEIVSNQKIKFIRFPNAIGKPEPRVVGPGGEAWWLFCDVDNFPNPSSPGGGTIFGLLRRTEFEIM